MTAYERLVRDCIAAAEAWERAAEMARQAGNLGDAYTCSNNAIRLRWLADPSNEVAELYNLAVEMREAS